MADRRPASVLHDLEDNVTCSLCMDIFQRPRALPCLHAFCEECLKEFIRHAQMGRPRRQNVELSCPVCCTKTKVPPKGVKEFPIAFIQNRLVDTYSKAQIESEIFYNKNNDDGNIICTLCTEEGSEELAKTVCPQCKDALCDLCTESHMHVHPTHDTIPYDEVTKQQLMSLLKQPRLKEMAEEGHHFKFASRRTKVRTVTNRDKIYKSMFQKPKKIREISLNIDPSGVSCTPEGNIVICEWNGVKAAIVSPEGEVITKLQTPAGTKAFDVECDAETGDIYMTDRNTDTVLVFDREGMFQKSLEMDEIYYDISDLIDSDNNYGTEYVSGVSMYRNSVYTIGRKSKTIIARGIRPYENPNTKSNVVYEPFEGPVNPDVALDEPAYVSVRNDTIAVSCSGDHTVRVMDRDGRHKYTFGTPGQLGKGPSYLNGPRGVVLDSENTLLVADFHNDRVCFVSAEGKYLGYLDLAEDQLHHPQGLAINSEGHLVVTCYKPNCMAVYEYRKWRPSVLQTIIAKISSVFIT